MKPVARTRFARYAWVVLAYNILVILWGAYVRATGSGAGCGRHWPTCDGQILPRPETMEMIVEFTHRLSSGLALIGVIGLLLGAWRIYPPGHHVRRARLAAMLFMVIEALLGAGLVLFEWVAHNVSLARAGAGAIHLVNTFFLLAALTLTAWWAAGHPPLRARPNLRTGAPFLVTGLALLFLGASGAITALGDTLILRAGITPDQSPLLARFVELRVYHPLIAVTVGLLVLWTARAALAWQDTPEVRRLVYPLVGVYVLQLLLGAVNVYLRAPVAVQLLHLLLSDIIWILFVLTVAQTLSVPRAASAITQVERPAPASAP